MSEKKHTPGPWKWCDLSEPEPGTLYAVATGLSNMDGEWVLYPDIDKDSNPPCETVCIDPGSRPLIAAAPDLLEACELITKGFKSLLDAAIEASGETPDDSAYELINIAEKAMAKAKGETE